MVSYRRASWWPGSRTKLTTKLTTHGKPTGPATTSSADDSRLRAYPHRHCCVAFLPCPLARPLVPAGGPPASPQNVGRPPPQTQAGFGLLQRGVATQLSTNIKMVTNPELARTKPALRFIHHVTSPTDLLGHQVSDLGHSSAETWGRIRGVAPRNSIASQPKWLTR